MQHAVTKLDEKLNNEEIDETIWKTDVGAGDQLDHTKAAEMMKACRAPGRGVWSDNVESLYRTHETEAGHSEERPNQKHRLSSKENNRSSHTFLERRGAKSASKLLGQ